jgi:hypothetical protein
MRSVISVCRSFSSRAFLSYSSPVEDAVAQGEAEIEPDRVLDDLGRETMTAAAERSHLDILSDTPASPVLLNYSVEPLSWTPKLRQVAKVEPCP